MTPPTVGSMVMRSRSRQPRDGAGACFRVVGGFIRKFDLNEVPGHDIVMLLNLYVYKTFCVYLFFG